MDIFEYLGHILWNFLISWCRNIGIGQSKLVVFHCSFIPRVLLCLKLNIDLRKKSGRVTIGNNGSAQTIHYKNIPPQF